MRSVARTPFAAVFRTELLLNSKRAAPYAMAVLFAANAWLWTVKGAAVYYGWAANGDYFIVRSFGGFSFMTLPLFTALLMGDPVIRDFRAGISPLVFSKPLGRASYLLGKFCGNFFVLVCCQAAFAATFAALQAFPAARMVVQPARVLPFATHFLLVVVVSHLLLAAVCFTVGTLTRNPKIVYGLAVSVYPLYAAYQTFILRGLPWGWRVALDPLLMSWSDAKARRPGGGWIDAAAVNALAFDYDAGVLANRALMLAASAACFAFLYARFSTVERSRQAAPGARFTTIGLADADERVYAGAQSFAGAGGFAGADSFAGAETPAGAGGAGSYDLSQPQAAGEAAPAKTVALPEVGTATEGARASLRQLAAACAVEMRLLSAERGLVVLLPLAALASVLALAYYDAAPDPSYSAAYAARTYESFTLFLVAIAVFYTGEAMHRDRELRFEPVLWSVPAPNFALLLSKYATTLALALASGALVFAASVALQIYKGHAPVEVVTHLSVYAVMLPPSAAFMIAAATALNVLLRDKHLAYAACLALAGGLFYLFNLGYNHPLYNPALHGVWTPADLAAGSPRLPHLLAHRLYCLALAALCLAVAHLRFERASAAGLVAGGRLTGKGWSLLVASASAAAALAAGLIVYAAART